MAVITITSRSGKEEIIEVQEGLDFLWQVLTLPGRWLRVKKYDSGMEIVVNKTYVLKVEKSANEA